MSGPEFEKDQPSPGEPPVRTPEGGAIGEPTKDERLYAMLAHLVPLAAALFSAGVAGFLGALIIWLIKKDESPFVDDQGKESLNFQLTLLIAYAVCIVAAIVTCGIGAVLFIVPFVIQVIFGIIAAIKANEGVAYRYPINIRFIT